MENLSKIIIIEKDGALMLPDLKSGFPREPWEQFPRKGVEEKILEYVAEGWIAIAVSDQRGIELGAKTLEECKAEMRYMLRKTPIREAFFCPDIAGQSCWRIWGKGKDFEALYDKNNFEVKTLDAVGRLNFPYDGMFQLIAQSYLPEKIMVVAHSEQCVTAATMFSQKRPDLIEPVLASDFIKDRLQPQPGDFYYHYKNPDKIYQIVGIAITDNLNARNDYAQKKADFFAKDAEDNEDYFGFILPDGKIIMSINRNNPSIGDHYVLYRPLLANDEFEGMICPIWARSLTNFTEDVRSASFAFRKTPRFTRKSCANQE